MLCIFGLPSGALVGGGAAVGGAAQPTDCNAGVEGGNAGDGLNAERCKVHTTTSVAKFNMRSTSTGSATPPIGAPRCSGAS